MTSTILADAHTHAYAALRWPPRCGSAAMAQHNHVVEPLRSRSSLRKSRGLGAPCMCSQASGADRCCLGCAVLTTRVLADTGTSLRCRPGGPLLQLSIPVLAVRTDADECSIEVLPKGSGARVS